MAIEAFERVHLDGTGIDRITEDEVVAVVRESLARGRGGRIITPNVDILRRVAADPGARRHLDDADLIVADGMPLIWASRLGGVPLPERVAGSSLIWSLSEGLGRDARSVFVVGGAPAGRPSAPSGNPGAPVSRTSTGSRSADEGGGARTVAKVRGAKKSDKPGVGRAGGAGKSDKSGVGRAGGAGKSDKSDKSRAGRAGGAGKSDKSGVGRAGGAGKSDKSRVGKAGGAGKPDKSGVSEVGGARKSDKPGVSSAAVKAALSAAAAAKAARVAGRDGAARAAARLAEAFPDLRIAGTLSPEFGFEEDETTYADFCATVVAARPDLVFVGLGFPKQELVIERLRPELPGTWFVGCGAAVNFVAGDIERAPRWMQRTGLEWAHRLGVEPRRLAGRYLRHDAPYALRLLARAPRRRARRP